MRLVTDSTSDLPSELVKKHRIEIVPLKVQLGEETYLDYFGLDLEEFYRTLRSTDLFPTTSQPSPQDFVESYEKLSREDDCLISIHISSKLSATCQSAFSAAQQLPDVKIHVIDSQQVSVGLGMIVLAAARAIEAGKGFDEVLGLIHRIISQIKTYFSVDSLEYLHRGGRIGRAQAFLGTMLRIKPLLAIQDGEVVPVEKVRSRGRLIRRMVELVEGDASQHEALRVGLIRTDNEEALAELSKRLALVDNLKREYVGRIGGVITSHVGPGTMAISYYPGEILEL